MIAAIVMAVRFVGCGLEGATPPSSQNTVVTGNLTGHGIFSAKVTSPETKPETQEYDKAGPYSYSIPFWCTIIDVILLGAGGGGGYGGANDVGGGGGSWKTTTLQRGSDIPWASTTISVTVGQGGIGGTLSAPQGSPGGDTTATWDTTTGTASGGAARGSSSGVSGDGPSPSSESIGDASLNGGIAQPTAGADGNPPGGGGAGGGGLKQGGAGADGAAVFVARQG